MGNNPSPTLSTKKSFLSIGLCSSERKDFFVDKVGDGLFPMLGHKIELKPERSGLVAAREIKSRHLSKNKLVVLLLLLLQLPSQTVGHHVGQESGQIHFL